MTMEKSFLDRVHYYVTGLPITTLLSGLVGTLLAIPDAGVPYDLLDLLCWMIVGAKSFVVFSYWGAVVGLVAACMAGTSGWRIERRWVIAISVGLTFFVGMLLRYVRF